jgi:hypothetical protein
VRRINRLYQFAFGREAHVDELAEALEFVDLGEPPASGAVLQQLAWQFGWGTVDDAAAMVQFQTLPQFVAGAWQGGPQLPDPALGWAMLNGEGGHPGDTAHLAIRRWVAPAAGTVHVEGVLSHASDQGDGVRGRIITSRGGVKGEWVAFHGQAGTEAADIPLEAGDTIDFVIDGRAEISFDTFAWPVTVRMTSAEITSKDGANVQIWDSTSGFHGPLVPPLSRWEQLAQVLLMSNEFMFVD